MARDQTGTARMAPRCGMCQYHIQGLLSVGALTFTVCVRVWAARWVLWGTLSLVCRAAVLPAGVAHGVAPLTPHATLAAAKLLRHRRRYIGTR